MTGLVRTQYWNVSGPNPTPRTGATSRAESRTEVQGYLLASDAARNAALHGRGVAAGLEVSAVAGTAGVRVASGVALDLDGHVVVLGDRIVPAASKPADAVDMYLHSHLRGVAAGRSIFGRATATADDSTE